MWYATCSLTLQYLNHTTTAMTIKKITTVVVVTIVIIKLLFNSAGLQAHKVTAGAVPARFREVKCRSGATGGASLMLPVSNSDRSVHLLPPDLCLSLLRASTAGLTHQVKTTDNRHAAREHGICVHPSNCTYQKNSRWNPARRKQSRQ